MFSDTFLRQRAVDVFLFLPICFKGLRKNEGSPLQGSEPRQNKTVTLYMDVKSKEGKEGMHPLGREVGEALPKTLKSEWGEEGGIPWGCGEWLGMVR